MATRADQVVIDDMSTGFATPPSEAVPPVEPAAVESEQPEEEAPQADVSPVPSPNIETDTQTTPTPVPEVPAGDQQDGYNFFPYETAADIAYPQAADVTAQDIPEELDPSQMFPSMYYQLEEQGKFEGDPAKEKAFRASVAKNYRSFFNFKNKPDRERIIMEGAAFAYGNVDDKGEPIFSEDGLPEFTILEQFTQPDIDGRLIELAEANKANGNPSLQYYIIMPDDGRPLNQRLKRINVREEYYGSEGTRGFLTPKQEALPYVRDIVRIQDEDGGMKFYDDTLKFAKIPIEQRIPLLRNEANKGFMAPIQVIRGFRNPYDTLGAVGQGLTALESVAYDFTAKIPFDIIQAGWNMLTIGDNPRTFGKMGEAIVDGPDGPSYEFGTMNRVGPYLNQPAQDILSATGIPTLQQVEKEGSRAIIGSLQKKFVGTDAPLTEAPMLYASLSDYFTSNTSLTKEQIDVILAYNEDFLTTLMEFGMESLIFGGAINGTMLHLSAGVVEDFADFAIRRYGGKEFVTKTPTFRPKGKGKARGAPTTESPFKKAKVADQREWIEFKDGKPYVKKDFMSAVKAIEASGKNVGVVMREYISERAKSGVLASFAVDALELGIQVRSKVPGPFRNEFFAPDFKRLNANITSNQAKLKDALDNPNASKGYIKTLRKRISDDQKDLLRLKHETFFPEEVSRFWRDEKLSTFVGAAAFQTAMTINPGDEFTASVFATVGSVASVIPYSRFGIADRAVDFYYMLGRKIPGVEMPSKEAVAGARALRNAPPFLQDRYQAFLEAREEARFEFSKFVYPETHEKAGQQIVDDSLLDRAFYYTAGLLAGDGDTNRALNETLGITDDVRGMSAKLAEIIKTHEKKFALSNALAEVIEQMAPVKLSPDFDPDSSAGQLIGVLEDYQKLVRNQLELEEKVVAEMAGARKATIVALYAGRAGYTETEEFIENRESITDLLSLDYHDDLARRSIDRGYGPLILDLEGNVVGGNYGPDVAVGTDGRVLKPREELVRAIEDTNDYFSGITLDFVKAEQANRRYRLDSNKVLANDTFVTTVSLAEQKQYALASANFNLLRASDGPYKDVRIDVTELYYQLTGIDPLTARQIGDPLYEADEDALKYILPYLQEGTATSRSITGLTLSPSQAALVRVFESGASESVDAIIKDFDRLVAGNGDFEGLTGSEIAQKIFEDAEIPENASNIQRFNVLNEFIRDGIKSGAFSDLSPQDAKALTPKLGLDVTTYMHVVSGLGRRAASKAGSAEAIMPATLREKLLDHVNANAYEDFYGLEGSPRQVESLGPDWEQARTYYEKNYIEPFRERNSVIAKIIRTPDETLDASFREFKSYLKSKGFDGQMDGNKIQSVLTDFKKMLGVDEIDVNTPEGQILRRLFTRLHMEQLSQLPGGQMFASLTKRQAGGIMAIPDKITELGQDAIMTGFGTGPDNIRLDNLTYRDPDTGEYLFADVNGEPILDMNALEEVYGFETLYPKSQLAMKAKLQVDNMLTNYEADALDQIRDIRSPLRNQVEAARKATDYLGGLPPGQGFMEMAMKPNGMQQIELLKSDFINARTRVGVDPIVASQAFDDMVADQVKNYIFKQITEPGMQKAFVDVGPTGQVKSNQVKQMAEIDSKKLLNMIGFTGDTLSETADQRALRRLIGDESYDNFKRIGQLLFSEQSKTMGGVNLTGMSMPLSGESLLSRATSYFRGVISLRWLISEAAIRQSRLNDFELTKGILFDPDIGREIEQIVLNDDFNFDKDFKFVQVTLSAIARANAVLQYFTEEEERQNTPAVVRQAEDLAGDINDQSQQLFGVGIL